MWSLATTILLATHLVAMNLAGAGPLLCVWMQSWRSRGNEVAGLVGLRMAWVSLGALLTGIVLGLLQLVALPSSLDEAYWEMLARFPASAYRDAGLELLFTLAALGVYIASWNWGRRRPWAHGILAVFGSTNLLYHFPPLMVAMRELAVRPRLAAEETLTRAVLRGVMARPEVVAMCVHFTLASVAVAGVMLIVIASRITHATDDARAATRTLVRYAAAVSLVPTLLQIVVGIWLLASLPAPTRSALMGSDLWASLVFVLSLAAAIGLMHVLSTVALGDTSGRQVQRATAIMLTVVLLMTTAMVQAR